ncbi:MAG: hypothetical protein MUC98_10225, partial [Desulfobacterota bacterium]|nr:hypothetical protein [Thermodesulfobacteriota bacterium]
MKDRPYWNKRMETLTPEEYRSIHTEKLLKQLAYVSKNSLFYQKKFRESDVDVKEIKSLKDLGKLPLTEKAELRDSQLASPPLGLHMACAMKKVKRIYSTSGTTGRPTFIGLTKRDLSVWREATSRAFWTGGFRGDSIVPLVVAPYLIAASYMDAIENVGTCVPIGVGATDRLIAAFQFIGANALLSTSSFPLHFADSLRKRGIDPRSGRVHVATRHRPADRSLPARGPALLLARARLPGPGLLGLDGGALPRRGAPDPGLQRRRLCR